MVACVFNLCVCVCARAHACTHARTHARTLTRACARKCTCVRVPVRACPSQPHSSSPDTSPLSVTPLQAFWSRAAGHRRRRQFCQMPGTTNVRQGSSLRGAGQRASCCCRTNSVLVLEARSPALGHSGATRKVRTCACMRRQLALQAVDGSCQQLGQSPGPGTRLPPLAKVPSMYGVIAPWAQGRSAPHSGLRTCAAGEAGVLRPVLALGCTAAARHARRQQKHSRRSCRRRCDAGAACPDALQRLWGG